MQTAITWESLFGVGFILGGLVLCGTGAISVLAGGMSDAPSEGDSYTSMGCFIAIGGALLLGLGIWMVR